MVTRAKLAGGRLAGGVGGDAREAGRGATSGGLSVVTRAKSAGLAGAVGGDARKVGRASGERRW